MHKKISNSHQLPPIPEARVCVNVSVCACVCARMRVGVWVWVHACICVSVQVRMSSYTRGTCVSSIYQSVCSLFLLRKYFITQQSQQKQTGDFLFFFVRFSGFWLKKPAILVSRRGQKSTAPTKVNKTHSTKLDLTHWTNWTCRYETKAQRLSPCQPRLECHIKYVFQCHIIPKP